MVFTLKTLTKGPLAFAGGRTATLADYRTADPTGVPHNLANADQVKRGEYLARAVDCLVAGVRLHPAMLYTSYIYMTDADALAIKAYLFSLRPCMRRRRTTRLHFHSTSVG